MARRRRNREPDIAAGVAQLAGIAVLVCLISPQARQIISGIGFIAICIVGVVLVGLIGFGVYRFTTRSHRTPEVIERNVDWQALGVDAAQEGKPPQPRSDLGEYVVYSSQQQEQHKPKTTADLIEQLRAIDWFQFEKLVELVYRKLGYAVTRRGGANPDGGIDLVIEKDGQRSAVQCKQWKTWNVGVKAVREFLGALTHAGIQNGIFITLRGYTADAKELAEKHGIEIVNEVGLTKIIEDTNARFDPEMVEILDDTRKLCPKCEREMVVRTAQKGANAGNKFWGCSAYPKCRFTMPICEGKTHIQTR